MNQEERKVRVAALSVCSNATLVALKLVVGVAIGSVSVVSEAVHSGVDLLAAVIALFSVKTASLPADRRHPFGHGKFENVSGTVEALLIFAAAAWIIYEAGKKLLHPAPLEAPLWGVAVMLVSTAVNGIVSRRLFQVGRETDSIALQADAWHLRTDVYTSAAVMASLAAIWIAGPFFPGRDLSWLDPVAALAVAFLILRAAYDLTLRSARDLLDVRLPEEEVDWIRRAILEDFPAVHGLHDLRTRKAGPHRFIEFHLKVDPAMTVADSHAITKRCKQRIAERFPDATVTIHVEPCDHRCADKCLAGCLLPAGQRSVPPTSPRGEPAG